MNETMQELIARYGEPAWRAAERQVTIDTIVAAFFFIVTVAVIFFCWRYIQKQERDFDNGWVFAAACVGLLALLMLPLFVYSLVTYIVNPEWMVIQLLLP